MRKWIIKALGGFTPQEHFSRLEHTRNEGIQFAVDNIREVIHISRPKPAKKRIEIITARLSMIEKNYVRR